MTDKLSILWPEIALFIGTCLVMVLGLSPTYSTRRLCSVVSAIALVASLFLAIFTISPEISPAVGQMLFPGIIGYSKVLIAIVGLTLLPLLAGVVDRDEELSIATNRTVYNPLRTNRAEFYAFYLFSLTGLMLCASADDLIWLFLALELTSLPTYIMVTISGKSRSHEAGVKYFFLGAFGAATFLFGFALLYGGTGHTNLNQIARSFAESGINDIAMAGLVLSVLGLCFKIAAVPMHFYTPDVYEGAASPVAAMLAFVPKMAGFLALILVLGAAGWSHGPLGASLPEPIRILLWVIAALTMTVGNVLALLQTSVKRILAYSSIAHSGYMLVGLIAGPGTGSLTSNGIAAILFYLLTYGVMNMGCFAVLACLERESREGPEELRTVDDLKGLCTGHPALGWSMVICSAGLLGLPPLLGFWGKIPLFTSAISAGEIVLVVVLGLNSAIAAFYYLRLAGAPLLEKAEPDGPANWPTPYVARVFAALISAGGVVTLVAALPWLMPQARDAARFAPTGWVAGPSAAPQPLRPPVPAGDASEEDVGADEGEPAAAPVPSAPSGQ